MIDPKIEELLEHWYVEQVEGGPAGEEFPRSVVTAAASAGLIAREHNRWHLTEIGRRAGRDVVRRHRLAECLLRDVLGVEDKMLDTDACRLEHILRKGLDEKVCALLGHPGVCPHGKEIPQGPCCRRSKETADVEVGPLSDAAVNAEGTVACLTAADMKETRKLMALGILPGVSIRLDRKFPSYVFTVGYSQFTIDRNLAGKILVRWNRPPKR